MALRRESAGAVALTLSTAGLLFAPGFWVGFPQALAAGGALLGWAGLGAIKSRRLSLAAFVIGVLGMIANAASFAVVFIERDDLSPEKENSLPMTTAATITYR